MYLPGLIFMRKRQVRSRYNRQHNYHARSGGRFGTTAENMLGEIRSRALDQQAQIDLAQSRRIFKTISRISFLADQRGMSGIIIRAERRAVKIAVMATMVASNSAQPI